MMLDISFVELRKGAMKYVSIGIAVGAVLLAEMIFMMLTWAPSPQAATSIAAAMPEGVANTTALGRILYTQYILPFQVSGLILLVAMIGAICLTLRTRPGVLRQKVADQVGVQPDDVIEIRKVQSGQGVS
jgi:NADH-quinone oxidoreductase subunit J